MIPSRKFAAVLLATLAGAAAIAFSVHAQPQPQIPMPAQQPAAPASTLNHNLVLLDPAHGGTDSGVTFSDHTLEKDLTLAFALKLRAALAAANFTVATTRDAEITDPLTPDQRAELANRTHAVACIVLHATASGSGLHIYTSTLQPPAPDADAYISSTYVPVPWESAQAPSIDQSHRLAADLISAFTKANLPALSGQAALRPLDNLTCPAVAIEIAPLLNPGEDPTPPTDASYQQRVVTTLTSALQTWRDHADPQSQSAPASPENSAQSKAIAAAEAAGLAATRSHTAPAAPPAQRGPQ